METIQTKAISILKLINNTSEIEPEIDIKSFIHSDSGSYSMKVEFRNGKLLTEQEKKAISIFFAKQLMQKCLS